MPEITIHHGDSREVLKTIPDASIDACVTDPPYALVSIGKRFGKDGAAPARGDVYARASAGFMGQQWDTGEVAFDPAFWAEVLRVLKPGAHLAAFGGTRTYHRLVCAIEDAGFEIRDQIAWLYGSGFPKSMNVGRMIDKADRGAPQGSADPASPNHGKFKGGCSEENESGRGFGAGPGAFMAKAGACDDRELVARAEQWTGWGTALKPAIEPIVLARKPLGTSGVNVLETVESNLRANGVKGDIIWVSDHAKDAAKSSPPRGSSSIPAPRAAETSAESVGASEIKNAEPPNPINSEMLGDGGTRKTPEDHANSPEGPTQSCETKPAQRMAVDAPAAASESLASSPSTTLKGEERDTGNPYTAKSTLNFGDWAIHPGTEFFAGIATGLTGSMDRVPIIRTASGSFVWPKGLPRQIDPRPLTVAANVLAHGTGGLNIDACRIDGADAEGGRMRHGGGIPGNGTSYELPNGGSPMPPGRWPANVVHDGSDEVLAAFPDMSSGGGPAIGAARTHANTYGKPNANLSPPLGHNEGSAARFFYSAKADAEDRLGSRHPTVKPTDLMRWLCTLITPPGGTVLDPFAGSGSTGLGAYVAGFDSVLIEREAQFVEDIKRRAAWVRGQAPITSAILRRGKPEPEASGLLAMLATPEPP